MLEKNFPASINEDCGKFTLSYGAFARLHEIELSRRRKKETLEINSLDKAENNFNELMNEINSFNAIT